MSELNTLNLIVDVLVPIYAIFVCGVILLYATRPSSHRSSYSTFKLTAVDSCTKKNIANPESDLWKKPFNATWLQHDSERFDEFLQFSGTTYIIRKLAPILFHRVRHTYTVAGSEFVMLRDFGKGVKDWTLRLELGIDEETAKEVVDVIDTGETYHFKAWVDKESKKILMRSTPADKKKGVINLHVRSIIDDDNMKMDWFGYNIETDSTCEMVSYFKRVDYE